MKQSISGAVLNTIYFRNFFNPELMGPRLNITENSRLLPFYVTYNKTRAHNENRLR